MPCSNRRSNVGWLLNIPPVPISVNNDLDPPSTRVGVSALCPDRLRRPAPAANLRSVHGLQGPSRPQHIYRLEARKPPASAERMNRPPPPKRCPPQKRSPWPKPRCNGASILPSQTEFQSHTTRTTPLDGVPVFNEHEPIRAPALIARDISCANPRIPCPCAYHSHPALSR